MAWDLNPRRSPYHDDDADIWAYDVYKKPIYYGEMYYEINGDIIAEESIDLWLDDFIREAVKEDEM